MLTKFNFKSNEIRVIDQNGEPWFIASDVCKILGHSNVSMALSRLDDDERAKLNLGRQGETNVINESGLYSLILGSRKVEAKVFKRWVTHEVLPSIRKHGAFISKDKVEEILTNPDLLIDLAMHLKVERDMRQKAMKEVKKLEQGKPKIEFYDQVMASEDTITANVIAKELGMSAVTLNKILHQRKVIYKQGDNWVLYAKYQDKGYTKTKTFTYRNSEGNTVVKVNLVWTQKGREFIHKMIKGE